MSTSKLLAIGASVKNNLAGSGPPASTDDSSAGYAAGSMWLDAFYKEVYVCMSATVGSALWLPISRPKEFGSFHLQGTVNVTGAGSTMPGLWYPSTYSMKPTNTVTQSASTAPSFVLKAGKRYKLHAIMYVYSITAAERMTFAWHDASNNNLLGLTGSTGYDSSTTREDRTSPAIAYCDIPASGNKTIYLRVDTLYGTISLNGQTQDNSIITIEEY